MKWTFKDIKKRYLTVELNQYVVLKLNVTAVCRICGYIKMLKMVNVQSNRKWKFFFDR